MEENPNNDYFITYSNSFLFEGVLLSFRKKKLFRIDKIPIYVPFNENAKCWIVNRKQLTLSKSKKIITNKKITINLSGLQWYKQINLDYIFNL